MSAKKPCLPALVNIQAWVAAWVEAESLLALALEAARIVTALAVLADAGDLVTLVQITAVPPWQRLVDKEKNIRILLKNKCLNVYMAIDVII